MAHELISLFCTKTVSVEHISQLKRGDHIKFHRLLQTVPVEHISQLERGDHIKFHRLLYTHHGIVTNVWEDIKTFEVIGMGIDINQTQAIGLKRSIEKISKWRKIVPVIYKYEYRKRLDPEGMIEMIEYLLENREKIDYDLLSSNCEHVARFCATGKYKSQQADRAKLIWNLVVLLAHVLAVVDVVLDKYNPA